MSSGAACGVSPRPDLDDCAKRRARLAERLGEAALVLYGGELKTRSNDTEFRFRPDSDFYYLTGLAEPGAVMVLRPGHDPELTLFVRPRDPEQEVWTGRRIGPEGAVARFGADAAHPLQELGEKLPELLDGAPTVYMPLAVYRRLDQAVHRAIANLRRRNRTGTTPPEALHDARLLIGEDRIAKDPAALASLRRAVDITTAAHVTAMRAVAPGMREFQIEALLEYEFRRAGAGGPGYASIVGGGANATVLHYVDNDDFLHDGQLLLVDAGAEWDLMSADLTRTFPIGGRFSAAQRDLYQVVLRANHEGIERAVVGGDIDDIHHGALETLCEGLIDLGLLEGSVEQAIEQETYKRFYMHRTSHWLGADVHDAGYYTLQRKPRALQPGFVLTVEPGLYVSPDDEQVPEAFRGIGIRIEDDVLVTPEGPEVLTASAPKDIDAIEDIVGSAR